MRSPAQILRFDTDSLREGISRSVSWHQIQNRPWLMAIHRGYPRVLEAGICVDKDMRALKELNPRVEDRMSEPMNCELPSSLQDLRVGVDHDSLGLEITADGHLLRLPCTELERDPRLLKPLGL